MSAGKHEDESSDGTSNRLLLVLSVGYPYDHGYEGTYAEADVAKAVEEVQAAGIACLCLAVGADPDADLPFFAADPVPGGPRKTTLYFAVTKSTVPRWAMTSRLSPRAWSK